MLLILHKCSEKSDPKIEQRNLQSDSDDYKNIRIYVNTDCLSASDDNMKIINNSIYRAKETIEKLVKVKRTSNYIYLYQYGISSIKDVSSKFSCDSSLTDPIPADLAVFVRESSELKDFKTDFGFSEIKYFVDKNDNNRPIIGIIGYFLNLNLEDEKSKEQAVYTHFLHEFTHILGFNLTILKKKGLINLESKKMRMNSKTTQKYYYKGDNVLNRARNYFNYPSLSGLEMDHTSGNEARDGGKIHWSERLLLGEYMTPNLYYLEQIISEFTLDLLKDLGWYDVNYYTGGLMRFGKNKGYNFINNDCVKQVNNYLLTNFENEFCSNVYSADDYLFETCSSGRQSMGYCSNTYDYNEFKWYDYGRESFSSYSGRGFSPSEIIEYCPFTNSDFRSSTNIKLNFKGSCNLGNTKNNGSNYFGISDEYIVNEYNDLSFCVFSSLYNKTRVTNQVYAKDNIRPNCYGIFCSERSLTIRIENEYIVCPREGGILNITSDYSSFKGYLFCPDYNLICTGSVVCNNIYDCAMKESTVKETTYDYDYVINKNVSVEVTTKSISSIRNKDINTNSSYEQSEDGVCPQYCSQCISNRKCILCDKDYNNYIGEKEDNATGEIKCSKTPPVDGYYNFTRFSKLFFYRCIDHCKLCYESDKTLCHQCYPTYFLGPSGGNPGNCTERIPGCLNYDNVTGVEQQAKDNGYGLSYTHCIECDNSEGYYCLDGNRTICHLNPESSLRINLTRYGPMETGNNPCRQKCDERFLNCDTCNYTSCVNCNQSNHFINYYGNCIKEIENCAKHNPYTNTSECLRCNEGNHYYCVKENRTYCQQITSNDFNNYSKITGDEDSCVQRCDERFTEQCLECTYKGCTKCKEGFFIYKGRCFENMTGCIDNAFNSKNETECNKCNEADKYYCFNLTRTQCYQINETTTNISQYFKYSNISYPCYGPCGAIAEHCIECSLTNCFACESPYDVNRRKTYCLTPPGSFREDTQCDVRIIKEDDSLSKNLNISDEVEDYFKDLDHINKVEHFVGKDYTMTIYINSNCTEGLLNEGYFKIDSNELNRTFIEDYSEYYNHITGVYINYNHRGYLSFYDLGEKLYLDPVNNCSTCMEKKYTMTHNLFNVLSDIIGAQFANFIIEKNLDIFSENSSIFTDSCENLTLHDIDIPIHLRKSLLFFHDYLEAIMCRDIACEFVGYDFKSKTSTCDCKLTLNYLDIFNSPKFEFVPYKADSEAKGFSEAVKVIKCLKEGIKWKNFKINTAAIVCLVVFILQVIFYVAYGCFGKPLANVSNVSQIIANPPKGDNKTKIYLFSDWVLNLPKKEELNSEEEEEKVIQPRDDSGDQIMEEEKSLNNDFFSDISIDTNAGGLFGDNKTNRSLRANEKNKKFLILLGNKSKKKKVSVENSIKQEIESESDSTPRGKFKRNEVYSLGGNYWLFLSIKQHIINYFSEIKYCKITESYIPLTLRLIRSLFLFILSIILSILWLDQKYFEDKWNHFNEKYSLLSSQDEKVEIPLSERISYALSHTITSVIVDLILLIFADFIVGIVFFKIREEVEKLLEKSKLSKIQNFVLKTRKYNNIFYALNFILVVIFFLSLAGFGVTYPGGVVDCMTSGIFAIFILEIVPFIWALILALFRYFGIKKKSKCMKEFSEYFLY